MKRIYFLLLALLPLFASAQRQTGGISFTPQWNYIGSSYQFYNPLNSTYQFIQPKLIAGTNITIVGNTINASGGGGSGGTTTYTLGNGYGINSFSFNGSAAQSVTVDTANIVTKIWANRYLTQATANGLYAKLLGGNTFTGTQNIWDGSDYGLTLGYGSSFGAIWAKDIATKTANNAALKVYGDGSTVLQAGLGGILNFDINNSTKIAIGASSGVEIVPKLSLYSVAAGSTSNTILTRDGNEVKEIPFSTLSSAIGTVADTTALKAYSGGATSIIVKDINSGGTFNYVASGLTSDGGLVYPATGKGSGYWQRQYNRSLGVNPCWWGADPTGTNNSSPAIQAAINSDQSVLFTEGIFRIHTPINLRERNFQGSGPIRTVFNVDAAINPFVVKPDLFYSRSAATYSDFAIMSYASNCNNNYAIYFPGVDTFTGPVYVNGITIRDIEIGGGSGSGFGGGIRLSSTFRVNITRVGMTSVRNAIAMIGSVVQTSLSDITCSVDNTFTSTLPFTGMYIQPATYSSGPLGTESIKTHSVSMIGYDTGLDYNGITFNSFTELDLDYCRLYGVNTSSEMVLERSYIAGQNSGKFIGVNVGVGVSYTQTRTVIKNNIIVAISALGDSSVAIQYGLGGATPNKYTNGGTIETNVIKGVAGGWKHGINADRNGSVRIIGNIIDPGVVRNIGIIATNSQSGAIEDNRISGDTILFTSPDVGTSGGSLKRNAALVVIGGAGINNPSTWDFGHETYLPGSSIIVPNAASTSTFTVNGDGMSVGNSTNSSGVNKFGPFIGNGGYTIAFNANALSGSNKTVTYRNLSGTAALLSDLTPYLLSANPTYTGVLTGPSAIFNPAANTTAFTANAANSTSSITSYFTNSINTGLVVGIEGSSAGTNATGSHAYTPLLNSNYNNGFDFATNNTVRYSIAANGDHDFKNGVARFGSLTASQLVATDASKNLVSTTVAAIGAVDLTTNQTIGGAKSFTTGIGLVGIGGGITTLNSANAGATNYSQNIQGKSGTIALLTDIPYQLRITGSGTGAATTISIAHGLSGVTSGSTAIVQPINAASAGISYITTDATNINIIYTVAPASGSGNLQYNVSIKP